MSKYYLAYGSNLSVVQMAQRCPNAVYVGTAVLTDYRLLFKGSQSGNYLTVEAKKGYTVPLLVWKISERDESWLDRYEGYPRHYIKEAITVQTADGSKIPVMAYIMAEPMCRQPALPSPYYYRAIQQGFEANGLPVESLEEAWNRTIDEIWLGKTDKPKNRKVDRNKNPER